MSEWTPQDYASVAAATVSVGAACFSWWSARRRLRWDASKELGTFRADTLELLRMAHVLDNPTWRRVSIKAFAEAQRQWMKDLQKFAPIIGRNAYARLLELAELFDQIKREVLGMPLGGLAAEEAQYQDDFEANDITHETREKLVEFWDRFKADPIFLSR